MANFSGGLSGAASGAAMGSVAGPWGTAIGAGVGGLLGLFGKKKKSSSSGQGSPYLSAPIRSYDQAEYNRYKAGYNDLTATFERRSKGEDIFDYMKYLFEPQQTKVKQDYGLTGDPNDIYSNRTGHLPQTLASLNSRGLLDTGTSGVVEGQLRSNMTNKIADLFGQSKQLQRQDIDNALDALHTLYPENFQIADIPYKIDYGNQLNQYNAMLGQNSSDQFNQAATPSKSLFGQYAPLLGQAAGTALTSYGGGGDWTSGLNKIIGNIFNTKASAGQSNNNAYGFGQTVPHQQQNYNMFSGAPSYSVNSGGSSMYSPNNIVWGK